MDICTCGREADFITVLGPCCWACTPTLVADVEAVRAFRSVRTGRVFAKGSTIPLAFLLDLEVVK